KKSGVRGGPRSLFQSDRKDYIEADADACCLGALSAAQESQIHFAVESSSSANNRNASLVERSSFSRAANSQIGLIASSGLPTCLVKLSSFSLSGIEGSPK